jgi:hypothetical protein
MEAKKGRLGKGLDKNVVTYIRTPILYLAIEFKKIAYTEI